MKKFFSMLLAAVLFMGCFTPVHSYAATVTKPTTEWAEENGWTKVSNYYTKTIDNVNYKLSNCWSKYDDLVGNNPSWQISVSDSPDASGVVTIPSTIDGYLVKSISKDAFRSNRNITECVITEGIENIGDGAFQYCYKLTNIVLPNGLKIIDAGAFYDCQLLTKITVPASVEYVGRTAFKRNDVEGNGLETLTFEGSAPEILYTSEYVGYSLGGLDGVVVYIYEDTTGWDSEVWTVLNLKKIKEVTEITLDKSSVELEVGEATTVTATVYPEDATDKEVTWSVEDGSIATVEDGTITAVAEGTTLVTASCGDVTATVSVTGYKPYVEIVPVTEIVLDLEVVELEIGDSTTIIATVYPEDATDKEVTWSVEDESIATVEDGTITVVAEGTTVVTASCGDVTATVSVTGYKPYVEIVPVTEIVLDKEAVELEVGDSTTVTATVYPEDATDKEVTWFVEDESIATVEDGTITAVAEGTTVVTASCGDVTATVNVTVNEKTTEPEPEVVPVTEIVLDKESVELEVGGSAAVTATVYPEDATDKTVTWTSSDESIATVENGVITAVAEGTATITASCGDVTAAVTVTVNKKDEPVLPPKDVTDIFIDVNEGAWYKDAIQYVFDEGLMSGNGEYFTPVKNMTRAQLVTTLYRLAGSPEVENRAAVEAFSDVTEGQYYTDAVCWAYDQNVTTGNNGKFNTAGTLTRQQLAAFMYRYAQVMGYDTDVSADYSGMLNADKVSEYAEEAMGWAVGTGLISGSKKTDPYGAEVYDLNPRGNTSRAQLATILQRFCESIVNEEVTE